MPSDANAEAEAGAARLLEACGRARSVLVAYSGGVDSTLVAVASAKALGAKATAVIADSPSLPRSELAQALEVAAKLGFAVETLATREAEDPRYLANPVNRCYFCKSHLHDGLVSLRAERGVEAIYDGNNLDDRGDFRPGMQAAAERGVRSPLVEAGFTKEMVRSLARVWGLPNADKPAAPCLSSRIPFGQAVNVEKLRRIEEGEDFLRSLGLRIFRLRHHEEGARIETSETDFDLAARERLRIVERLRSIGFRTVSLDLAPFRSGSLSSAGR